MNINQIVAKLANVSQKEYTDLVEVRGMRPSKALFRLGVEQQLAGILGTLKLASTADEINCVYANKAILSCMTGRPVGEYYAYCGIEVIYNDRYRCIIDQKNNWCNSRGYGLLCYTLDPVIKALFNNEEDPISLLDEVSTYSIGVDFNSNSILTQYAVKRQKEFPGVYTPFLDVLSDDEYLWDYVDPKKVVRSMVLPSHIFTDFCEKYEGLISREHACEIFLHKDFSQLETTILQLQELSLIEDYHSRDLGYSYLGIISGYRIYRNLSTGKYTGYIGSKEVLDRDTIEEALDDLDLPF